MKKYLSVLLIVLLSVFSFNMEVDAAQEMTCVYEFFASEKFLLIQTENGRRTLYINKKDEGIVGDWEVVEKYPISYGSDVFDKRFPNEKVLPKCPLYATQKYDIRNGVAGNYVIFFNETEKDYYSNNIVVSLIKSQSTEKKAIVPYRYEFKIKENSSEYYNDVLFKNICKDTNITCMVNGTYSGGSDWNNYDINNTLGWTDIKEFYVVGWHNDFNKLANGLKKVSCGAIGGLSYTCYKYVKEIYCKNYNDKVCADLNSNGITGFESIVSNNDNNGEDNTDGDNTGGDNGITKDSYIYPFTFYGSNKIQKDIRFTYDLNNSTLDIVFDDNDGSINILNNSVDMYMGNTLYFYGYDSNFDEFQRKFIEKVKQTSEQPQLSFCLRSRSGNNYVWYTELGTCDSNIYDSFYSQTINSDGTTSHGRFEVPEGDSNEIAGFEIYETCTEFLSNNDAIKLRDTLKFIVQLSRVLIPIIVFVFSTLDFAKAVFSGEEQTKKVKTNFFMRIAIAVVIFLLPTLLHFLLTIANQIWPNISTDLCGIL